MANQITDGRTNVDTMETGSAPDGLGGAASGTFDNEIFYQGAGSWGYFTTTARAGLLHDAGSAQDWSNNVFYLVVNCGIVGLLDTKANAGITVRFCGATVTDWFEVYVGGSDSWPSAFSGGWVVFAVDIEDARAAAIVGTVGGVNGTTPATTAIRYVGVSTITATTMPRMADNTWLDQIARLPDGSPGIIVEGRDGGTTDWDWSDIVAASDTGKWATARLGAGGATVLTTSVQFGINDTSTHGFLDTNKVVLWDDQEFVPSDLYKLSALGNSGGTTNVTMGIKTGSGDAATGAQGCTIVAAAAGVRWDMDFNDPNLDLAAFYGCQFIHTGACALDDAAVSVISTSFIDGTTMTASSAELLRCSIIDANTADGVAYILTDTPNTIKSSSFEFSDGHAIEITAVGGSPFTFTGNLFAGYGADATTDAAILIDGLTGVLNIGGGGDTPTKREISAGSLTINNNKTITFAKMKDNTEIWVFPTGTFGEGNEIAHIEDATSGSPDDRSFAWSAAGGIGVDYYIHNWQPGAVIYEEISVINFIIPSSDTTINIQQRIDRNVEN